MPHRMTCPSCEAALIVGDDLSVPFVTCPRCLARIPNPGVPESQLAVATPGLKPVLATWADGDVQQDTRRTGWGLLILPVLVTIAVGWYGYVHAKPARYFPEVEGELFGWLCFALAAVIVSTLGFILWRLTGKRPVVRYGLGILGALGSLLILGLLALSILEGNTEAVWALAGATVGFGFLALLSTGLVLWRTRDDPKARGIGRVVIGTFALVGGGILCILAILICFFAVCMVVVVGA